MADQRGRTLDLARLAGDALDSAAPESGMPSKYLDPVDVMTMEPHAADLVEDRRWCSEPWRGGMMSTSGEVR